MSDQPSFSPSDEQLMESVRLGDESAFETLYDRHNALVYGICIRMIRSPADAQAALADVFWQLWSKANHYDPNRVSLRTYLVILARSRSLDHLRASHTRIRNEDAAGRALSFERQARADRCDPDRVMSRQEEQARLKSALGDLPQAQRKSLELAYFNGMTHVQIAEHLKLPLGTVKSHIRLGVIALRSVLGKAAAWD